MRILQRIFRKLYSQILEYYPENITIESLNEKIFIFEDALCLYKENSVFELVAFYITYKLNNICFSNTFLLPNSKPHITHITLYSI